MTIPEINSEQMLLRFLRTSLLTDPELPGVIGCAAEDICRSVRESSPLSEMNRRTWTQDATVSAHELPVLAVEEQSVVSLPSALPGQRGAWKLWYMVPYPMADLVHGDQPLTPAEIAKRQAKAVWLGVIRYLRAGKLSNADGTIWDLDTNGGFENVKWKNVTYKHEDGHALFEADLEVDYITPPYPYQDPAVVFAGVTGSYINQSGTVPPGPTVETKVNLAE